MRGCLRVTVTEQNNCGNIGPLLDAESQQIEDEHDDEAAAATLWRAPAMVEERRRAGHDVGLAESGRARIADFVIWAKHGQATPLQRAYRQNRLFTHDRNERLLDAKRANRVPGQTIFRAKTPVDIPFCKPLAAAVRESKG
jgi:hypothetical protein